MSILYTGDANNVFETLEKYGNTAIVKYYKTQNGYGASLNYYNADWFLPGLQVKLLSSFHDSLSEQFGRFAIGLSGKSFPPPPNQRKL